MRDTNSKNARRGGNQQRGFTMWELAIVCVLLMIISAMAMVQLHPTIQQRQADAAMVEVASQLRQAREMAVSTRRDIQVQFVGTNQVVLNRLFINPAVVGGVFIQAPMTFRLTAGKGDTPDAYGNAGAIEFGGIVGGPPTMMFQSDGTFVDTAGNLINGTVFLGMLNEPSAARAVTLVGSTGRIRMWRNNAAAWVQ
ncbi:MAG: pilus assembly FimT family protein [Candidatus Acidiferrales bacterium]